jgi:flagellar protein FlaG
MVVDPVTAFEKVPAPMVQTSLPAGDENAQRGVPGGKAESQPDFSDVKQAIADVQQNLDIISNLKLQFSVHGASGKIMVTVRDEASGEVVREIPQKETLDLAAKLDAMIGLIFDQHG